MLALRRSSGLLLTGFLLVNWLNASKPGYLKFALVEDAKGAIASGYTAIAQSKSDTTPAITTPCKPINPWADTWIKTFGQNQVAQPEGKQGQVCEIQKSKQTGPFSWIDEAKNSANQLVLWVKVAIAVGCCILILMVVSWGANTIRTIQLIGGSKRD